MADEFVTSLYGLSLAQGFQIIAGSEPVLVEDDIVGDLGGDLELDDTLALRWTDGPEQARQEAECRLGFFLGEYFLDTRQGLPYFRTVLVKNPNKDAIRSMFTRAIASVPGLIEPVVGYSLDARSRKLAIDWEARWIDGRPVAPVKVLEVDLGG